MLTSHSALIVQAWCAPHLHAHARYCCCYYYYIMIRSFELQIRMGPRCLFTFEQQIKAQPIWCIFRLLKEVYDGLNGL